jgi:hypothetical protein
LTPIVVIRDGASVVGSERLRAHPELAKAKTSSAAAVVCRRFISDPRKTGTSGVAAL